MNGARSARSRVLHTRLLRARHGAGLLALALLSACGAMKQMDQRIDTADDRASRLAKTVGQVDSRGAATPTVVREPGIWIGRNTVKRDTDPLPALFDKPATFDRTVQSLSEFAERITLRSGVPTKVAADALATAGRAPAAGAAAATTNTASPVKIVYSGGSFKGLLDTAAARYGVFWKYSNGAIQFFNLDTRTFQISAIPGDASLNANVGSSASTESGGGGGGGGGGGNINSSNTQNIAVKSELSVFGNLEKAVAIMLSANGKVVSSPATGTLTVTDNPATLERVAAFLEAQNKTLAKQIMINVTVLAVTLTKSDNYGIKWNQVYNTLRNRYGITNELTSIENSTSFSAGILSTAASKWAGTNVVVQALSEQGNVRRETSASVVTLNNQPVPIQVAKQTAYLKSSETTQGAVAGSTTSLTPGQVTTGFNMSILPHILENGSLMLQFSTDISSLRNLRSVSSGSSKIESPEVDTRNFLQRVAMKSNETLIISGFEQTDDNIDRNGVGTPANLFLGGLFKGSANKEVIVILVTPVAMNGA